MAFESLERTDSNPRRPPGADRLSPSGQLIGWCVFGALVVSGFMFGVVTGYERPKLVVARAPKEPEPSKPETPKPAAKPSTESTASQPNAAPKDATPAKPPATATSTPAIKQEPKQSAVVEIVPPPENSKPPMPPAPPKTDPKPPATVATTPKTETTPKSEDVKSVSFKTEVLPILRRHCLDCHGGGKGKPRGDVDLTTIDKMKKSPSPGKMLVVGKPDESDVYTSITQRDMPDGGKPKPSKDELLVLKNWILSGAKD
jgi:hypothetical protein